MEKHYVYSARTTEAGLRLLNQAKGEMSWDQFLNTAISEHYKLDIGVIGLPPSRFLADRQAARELKAKEKAEKAAKAAADKQAKAEAKRAADKKKAARDQRAADRKAGVRSGARATKKPALVS